MITQYADAMAAVFNIPKGTNLSSYSKLYFAFLFSGTFHALSQLQMPSPVNITVSERTVGFLLFFIWQMAAITLEDFAQWLGKKVNFAGLSREKSTIRTWIGWTWVTVVMWKGLPLVGDTFLRLRMGVDSLLPYSLCRPLVEKWLPIPP